MNDAVPFVLDTDMGADDFMALSLLLRCSGVDLRAVTVTGTGLSHARSGARSALDILALGGRPDVEVGEGSHAPLEGDRQFPASWRKSTDERFGIQLPRNPRDPSTKSAVELLTSTILASARKPVLVAIGPLTNVAQALLETPRLAHQVEAIWIMGGAVDVPGNVHATDPTLPNTVAEWNFYIDPKAADVVLRSGASISLVPLDLTNQAPVTPDFLRRIEGAAASPLARFVVDVLKAQEPAIDAGQYSFWDPLAAGLAVQPSLAGYSRESLGVRTDPGPTTLGAVKRLGPDTTTRYGDTLTEGNFEAFQDFFVATLNRR